jgi:hypothetical protein
MTDPSFETAPSDSPVGWHPGKTAATIEDGVLCGIVGAAIVAVWFLFIDVARGQPFFTPSLLGSVLFLGSTVEEVTGVSWVLVFAYTGLHGVLFLLFQSVLFGLEVTLVPELVGALGASAVASANLFAAVGIFWFLLHRRPEVMVRLRESWNE